MKTNISITHKDDFRTWQKKAQKLFEKARAEELAHINEEYEDVLSDYATAKATSERIISEFSALLDSQTKKVYSWEDDEGIMEAYAVAMEEIERINTRFHTKWGNRYEEYLNTVDVLEKEHKKAIAMTRSYTNYQKVMKNLAPKSVDGGEANA
jgi:hypothetical protein